jgi:soluble lytic murein transglycosylase-like protein
MADVQININANMEAALKQVEEFRQKLGELSKSTISPNFPDFSKYQQTINQINSSITQLHKEIQRLQNEMNRMSNTNTGIFSRFKNMFTPSTPGGFSTNPSKVNHASVLLFDKPQDVATFLRSAGFTFNAREVQQLTNLSNRLASDIPLTVSQKNVLTNLLSKYREQSDVIAEKILQERKNVETLPETHTGTTKEMLNEIEKKFSALDKIAEYFNSLEAKLQTVNPPPSGGSNLGNWLRGAGGTALRGITSALGPVGALLGVGALSAGTYAYLQTSAETGALGMRLGLFNGGLTNSQLIRNLMGIGNTAGYYTANELAQGMNIQGLYGGQYAGNTGRLLLRDIIATGQLARGFGIDLNQAAQVMGVYQSVGGYRAGKASDLANAIASAIQSSGIDPRQFLQANQMLVQTLAQQVGNVNVKQTLALQAALDKLGKEYGLTSLIGTRGAQLLTQLNAGITTPGGGLFGEYAVLSAIQRETGQSLAGALWTQRKGLGGLSSNQIFGVLSDVWKKAFGATGNNKLAMGVMADIFGLQPGQLEDLMKITKGFTQNPTEEAIKQVSGGKAKNLQDLMKQWTESGAGQSAEIQKNVNDALIKLGDSTTKLVDPVSKIAAELPWAMVGMSFLPALGGSIIKGIGKGGGSLLGKIGGLFGKGAIAGESIGGIGEAIAGGSGISELASMLAPFILALPPLISYYEKQKKGKELQKQNEELNKKLQDPNFKPYGQSIEQYNPPPTLWDKIKDFFDKLNKLIEQNKPRATGPRDLVPQAYTGSLANYISYLSTSPFTGMKIGNGLNFSQLSYGGIASTGMKTKYDAIFEQAAAAYGISPAILKAVAEVESNFNPYAKSPAGAMGIMQLMPGTAKALGVTNPFDPVQNIMAGAKYLRQQLDRFGSLDKALAAYNAGPGAVEKYGGIPPYPETQNYVKKVIQEITKQMNLTTDDGNLMNYDIHITFTPKKGSPNYAPAVNWG